MKRVFPYLLLVLKGVIVGFGAIMPGISGGALCVAFGMYQPLLNLLSHPVKAVKADGWKLLCFLLGAGLGFVGLSGLADYLIKLDSAAVTCVFIGFILGTVPDLWKDAGKEGRKPSSFVLLAAGFAVLVGILLILRSSGRMMMKPGIWAYLFCGVMWGTSFIVPGLSSSTLLIFFGLYQPMLEGISRLDLSVVIPLAVGIGACVLALSRLVHEAYRRWYPQISHAIIGVVIASMVMVIPIDQFRTLIGVLWSVLYIVGGFAVAFFAGRVCEKLAAK